MEDLKHKIQSFLTISYGDGYGYGDGFGDGFGSGSGDGDGDGSGDGSGYGSGSGDGDGYGSGDGSGDGLKHYNNREVYIVDDTAMLIYSVKNNIASGAIINKDLTLSDCYIAKSGNYFAHGATIKEAREDLMFKVLDRDKSEFESLTLDDSVDADVAIQCYRVITGACGEGTKSFVRNELQGELKDSYTIREIIELTKGQYGAADFERFFRLN